MWDQILIEDNLKSRPDMNKVVTYYRFIFLLFAPPSPRFMLLGFGISRTADVAVIYKAIILPSEIRYWYLFHTVYEGWNFNSGNYLFTTDTK